MVPSSNVIEQSHSRIIDVLFTNNVGTVRMHLHLQHVGTIFACLCHKVLDCNLPYEIHNSASELEHKGHKPLQQCSVAHQSRSIGDGNKIIIKFASSYLLIFHVFVSAPSCGLSQWQMQFILEQKCPSFLDRSSGASVPG